MRAAPVAGVVSTVSLTHFSLALSPLNEVFLS